MPVHTGGAFRVFYITPLRAQDGIPPTSTTGGGHDKWWNGNRTDIYVIPNSDLRSWKHARDRPADPTPVLTCGYYFRVNAD